MIKEVNKIRNSENWLFDDVSEIYVKFCPNFKWKIFSNFVAFSEYPNFKYRLAVIKIGDVVKNFKPKQKGLILDAFRDYS